MKIKLSWWWIPYGVLIYLSKMWKTALFLFLILMIHEMAHILVARLFHYETKSVMLYPFGFGAEILHMGHGSILKENLILLAGPLVHLFVPMILDQVVMMGWISRVYAVYLTQLNWTMFFFNLLPIYPLDGGRICLNIIQLFIPYTIGRLFSYLFSIILLVILFLKIHVFSFRCIMIFLFFQQLLSCYLIKQDKEGFYYYRYLHAKPKLSLSHHRNDLYRFFHNVLYDDSCICSEQDWIIKYFQKH